MFDDLFDVFGDRDERRRDGARPRQGGIRGFFARLFGGGGDREDPRDDDPRGRTYRTDDDDDHDGDTPVRRRRQRRDAEGFDFQDGD